MSWNYRIIKHTERCELHDKNPKIPEYVEWYGIHEYYYAPDGWSDAIIVGESVEELQSNLQMMMDSLKKPIIEK